MMEDVGTVMVPFVTMGCQEGVFELRTERAYISVGRGLSEALSLSVEGTLINVKEEPAFYNTLAYLTDRVCGTKFFDVVPKLDSSDFNHTRTRAMLMAYARHMGVKSITFQDGTTIDIV